MSRLRARFRLGGWLPLALGTGLFAAGPGCELPNPDHCINRSNDANAWCAQRDPAFPVCSPCYELNAGCVAREPSKARCPPYSQPTSTGMDGDTSTDNG